MIDIKNVDAKKMKTDEKSYKKNSHLPHGIREGQRL